MKLVTHNGPFHADEVTAIALLNVCTEEGVNLQKNRGMFCADHPHANIIRTRNPDTIAEAGIVVDVGAVYDAKLMRFDHHQGDFQRLGSLNHLSSAGMVLQHLMDEGALTYEQGDTLFDALITGVDLVDNGTQYNANFNQMNYSQIISLFNPIADTEENVNKLMDKAIAFASELIRNLLRRHDLKEAYGEVVRKAVDAANPHTDILELPTFIPDYLHIMQDIDAFENFERVIWFDAIQNDWRVRAMPDAPNSMALRIPLGDGVGIQTLVFVHKSRFIGSTRTKADAFLLAEHGKR